MDVNIFSKNKIQQMLTLADQSQAMAKMGLKLEIIACVCFLYFFAYMFSCFVYIYNYGWTEYNVGAEHWECSERHLNIFINILRMMHFAMC